MDKPPRGEYLLDLVLTDMDDCKVQVLDQIADHKGILAKLVLPMPKLMTIDREVWHFKNASWNNLRCDLRACSWARLSEGSVDSAVNYFLDLLIAKCKEHIPFSRITFTKQTHPWIDDDCVQAIKAKNEAVGTDHFPAARDRCAEIINDKFQDHVLVLKDKISRLEKCDRLWWKLNRELIHKKAKVSSIPPLKGRDGTWSLDSINKANLFAHSFSQKYMLPPEVEDQFVARPENAQKEFIAIRTRSTYKYLSTLDVSCATGPDQISARILRELARVLALPLTILCRRILYEARWPSRWKVHNVVPIFKKASVYDPDNYRGVHLTSIVSKTVERVVGQPLLHFLEQHGFGKHQWAFRKKIARGTSASLAYRIGF